jgi:hypothetical protein
VSDRRTLPRRRTGGDEPFRVLGMRIETIVAIAVVAGLGIFLWVSHARNDPGASLRVTMRPSNPPPATVCIDQVREFGAEVRVARALCFQGVGSPWYHAVIRNPGTAAAYPACQAAAFSGSGSQVFSGDLELVELFPPEMRIEAEDSVAFDWYLPRTPQIKIARFDASCSAE